MSSRRLGPSFNLKTLLLGTGGFATVLAIWSALTYSGLVKPLFLPSPTTVFNQTIILFVEDNFLLDISLSVYRISVGFVIAAIIAVPLGVAIGVFRSVRAYLEPLIAFMRYLPAAAFVPLAILWLGIGDVEKMFIIFIGTLPYLTLLVVDIVLGVDDKWLQLASTFGASKGKLLIKVIIPAALPGIWDSLRIMFGIGWTYIIVAELVAARAGIGHVIIEAQRYLFTYNIIIGLIIIGILGLLTDFLFKYGYRKLFPYTVKSQRT